MRYLVTMLALIILTGCGTYQRTPAPVFDLAALDMINPTKEPIKKPVASYVIVAKPKVSTTRKPIAYASVATGHIKKTYAATPKANPKTIEAVSKLAEDYKEIHRIGIHELAYWVDQYSKDTNLPPRLILAVAAVESDFKTNTCSNHGACGMMGIKGSTWGVTRKALKNYRVSLKKGTEILATYKEQCRKGSSQLKCTVQMYNVGDTNYRSGVRSPRYLAQIKEHVRRMGGSM